MNARHRSRPVRSMKIFCPIDSDTARRISEGQLATIDRNCALALILGIIRGDNPLGDFGVYKSVVELASGWELFTPDAAAQPTLGEAGVVTVSPTAVLTVYIPHDAESAAVSKAIDAIMEAHPWEVPVVEMGETTLLVRS